MRTSFSHTQYDFAHTVSARERERRESTPPSKRVYVGCEGKSGGGKDMINSFFSRSLSNDNSDNETVQSKSFSENENQNHSYKYSVL